MIAPRAAPNVIRIGSSERASRNQAQALPGTSAPGWQRWLRLAAVPEQVGNPAAWLWTRRRAMPCGPSRVPLVAAVSGMAPLMRVPCPGDVSTRRVPPSAASRSRMLRSPVPVGTDPGSNPAPSSTTSNVTSRRLVAIVTSAAVAVDACLNVFWRASRQQK